MPTEFDFNMEEATEKIANVLDNYSSDDLELMIPTVKMLATHNKGQKRTFDVSESSIDMVGVAMAEAGLALNGSAEYVVQVTEAMINAFEKQQRNLKVLPEQLNYEIEQLKTLSIREKTSQLIAEMEHQMTLETLKTDWQIAKFEESIRYKQEEIVYQEEMIKMSYVQSLIQQANKNEIEYLKQQLEKDTRRLNSMLEKLKFWKKNKGQPTVKPDMIKDLLK